MNNKGFVQIIIFPIIIIIVFMIAFTANHCLNISFMKTEKQIAEHNNYQYDLIQISNTKDINGHINTGIFLGSGYIEEKPYYYMYIKKNDGIQLLKLEADDYSIPITIYQDSEKPYIKSTCIFIDNNVSFWNLCSSPCDTKQTIEIHIPPGSMVQNIDISAMNYK